MKQIIQSFKTGETLLEDIPAPLVKKGTLLIKTTYSLVSLGTERMLVEFGKASLVQKARQQPDKVKQVLDKIKTEGLLPTLETVFNKLDQPIPLGYCNVGRVIEVGEGITGFQVGDRVASNGNHAEYVCVPQNLVAKIPNNVTDEEACFTVISAIGLQGIRLLNPTYGETIVVIGLGLVGLVTAELLVANGCRVIGFDFDDAKIKIAQQKGVLAVNLSNGGSSNKFVQDITAGVGADGIIITASNKSHDIISQAAQMSRKRGRIILVGVVGLDLKRSDFYEKELSFQVSCSYGPGRYDDDYEQKGLDYPLPYVRWTEKRNFEAILYSMSEKKLNVKPLISEIIDLDNYQKIYGNIGNTQSIATLLKYKENTIPTTSVIITEKKLMGSKGVIGIIGAGNYTKMTILPIIEKIGAKVKSIASSGGLNGTALAKKYKIAESTTDYKNILDDTNVDLVMITTRHNSHAQLVIEALNANKHVFVEKPLAITEQELNNIIISYNNSDKTVTVGFNRRFSPHIIKMKSLLGEGALVNVVATMNAGFIDSNFWVHDMKIGGGRIIGEACHYIDLVTYLTGSKVIKVCMNAMGVNPLENTDNASILLHYENGSTGVINYFSNGSKKYSKERIEVYSQERTLILDNFQKLEGFGFKGFSSMNTKLDKGHKTQFTKLIQSVENTSDAIIPFAEIVNTTQTSFAAIKSLKEHTWISI